MMDELIAFARARLDEDEAAAKAAGGSTPQGIWAQVDPERRPGRIECDSGYVVTYDEGSPDEGQAPHIARHDPARVLREVEAKRAILAWWLSDENEPESALSPSLREEYRKAQPGYMLILALAAVWSDHPGYRQEWKP